MMIIGVGYHPSFQQITFLVEETGALAFVTDHSGTYIELNEGLGKNR